MTKIFELKTGKRICYEKKEQAIAESKIHFANILRDIADKVEEDNHEEPHGLFVLVQNKNLSHNLCAHYHDTLGITEFLGVLVTEQNKLASIFNREFY